MTTNWWVFIPDPYEERAGLIYDEAMGYGRIGLTFGDYMGDLTKYGHDDYLIAREYEFATKNTLDKSIASFVRMFRNVVDNIAIGDLVLYPATKVDGKLHVGRVTSAYKFNRHAQFIHSRDVQWQAAYPRSTFTAAELKKYPRSLAVSSMKDDNEFVGLLSSRLKADGHVK